MDEQNKDQAKDVGTHLLHGVEDVGEVLGHGIAGTVEGAADGVASVAATDKKRKEESN